AEVAQRLEGWEAVAVVNRRGRHPSGPLTDGYGLSTEIADTAAVVREFSDVRTLFGWSYGGLIALSVANVIAVPHVIAYEPVMAPFGAGALPDLHRAHASGELDESVDVALRRGAGMEEQAGAALRSQEANGAGRRHGGEAGRSPEMPGSDLGGTATPRRADLCRDACDQRRPGARNPRR